MVAQRGRAGEIAPSGTRSAGPNEGGVEAGAPRADYGSVSLSSVGSVPFGMVELRRLGLVS
jgi:hypothetical protein